MTPDTSPSQSLQTRWILSLLKQPVSLPLWAVLGGGLLIVFLVVADFSIFHLLFVAAAVGAFLLLKGKIQMGAIASAMPKRDPLIAKEIADGRIMAEPNVLYSGKPNPRGGPTELDDMVTAGAIPVAFALEFGRRYSAKLVAEYAETLGPHSDFRCVVIVDKGRRYKGHIPIQQFPASKDAIKSLCDSLRDSLVPSDLAVRSDAIDSGKSNRDALVLMRVKGIDHMAVLDARDRIAGFVTVEELSKKVLGF
ncbi:MAG: CBS domain-containing protein [Sumerlaeia bacterium]